MRVQLYSLREKSTKRLRALAHLMGSRVPHVLYIYCARTCRRIFARRARWALDLPRLLSLSLSLSFGRYRHGATRWAQGPSAPCHGVPFVTSHVARMFPFSRPASSPPKLWEDSRSACSSFFFYSCEVLRRAHDLLHSGNRFAEYNLPLPTPSRPVTCARHVRAFVAYLPQQTFNFFIRRSPFAGPLALDRTSQKGFHSII